MYTIGPGRRRSKETSFPSYSFSSRSLLFENSGRYSAAAIPKLPFTKTGRLGGSNQDLVEEEEDGEDADVMRDVVTSVRSSTGTGGGGSMSRYSSK